MTPMTRAEIVVAARVFALRTAIVDSLATALPEVTLRAHPGKVDIADMLAKDVFVTPSINVAVTRASCDERLSQADDLGLEIAFYLVADNQMIGGRLVTGDEFALALMEWCVKALADDAFTRWGLDETISCADEVKGSPLLTVKSLERGAVYYAVTFRQTLYALIATPFPTFGETL